MNLPLINIIAREIEARCGARRTEPGNRWIIDRGETAASVHIILNRGNDPDRIEGWIFDPKAVLGEPATFVQIPEKISSERFVEMVCRTAGRN